MNTASSIDMIKPSKGGMTLNDFFRPEAVKKRSQKHLGNVFLSSPPGFWLILILISTIILGVALIVSLGEYAQKERVTGTLTSDKGLVNISPRKIGNFEEVFVKTGDIINDGDPLYKIVDLIALSDGTSLSESLFVEMEKEQANLQTQLLSVPELFRLKRERLITNKQQLQEESTRLLEQIKIQDRAVEIEQSLFHRLQGLHEKDASSEVELSSAEQKYITAVRNRNVSINNWKKVGASIKDIESQLPLLTIEKAQSENDIKSRVSSLQQTILQTRIGSESVFEAPISGTIAYVTARKGQSASAEKTAISILPSGGKLEAELYVPTRSIGFIKVGQNVRLSYDAFPYQKFGYHEGEIVEISKTVLQSKDLISAPEFNEAFFLVIVSLDKQIIETSNEHIALQAGMSLSADLILEKRKLWEWVLGPLLRRIN